MSANRSARQLAAFKADYAALMAEPDSPYWVVRFEALNARSDYSVYFDIGDDEYEAMIRNYYSWLSPYAGGDKWLTSTEREEKRRERTTLSA
jgi:hypothetical protein